MESFDGWALSFILEVETLFAEKGHGESMPCWENICLFEITQEGREEWDQWQGSWKSIKTGEFVKVGSCQKRMLEKRLRQRTKPGTYLHQTVRVIGEREKRLQGDRRAAGQSKLSMNRGSKHFKLKSFRELGRRQGRADYLWTRGQNTSNWREGSFI